VVPAGWSKRLRQRRLENRASSTPEATGWSSSERSERRRDPL